MASVAQAPASPSSSPRLPSPPPFPEVQLPPKSPSPDPHAQDEGKEHGEDPGATRRIRPGTKAADMAAGPPLVPLSELDSPFQLQEHLLALFLSYTHSSSADDSSTTTVPITRATATQLATAPEGVDRALWLYELCRLLVQRANRLIVGFFADVPACSAAHCPEMRASEWQYLCAVHDPPKSCCAIDYCCHTLDWAANTLASQKHFPSRLSLGGDGPGSSSQASVRQLTNVFRRVYRMFAHAWFQHRDVFWRVEGEEGLYVFYKTVCDVYGLIPEENYTVPKEAENGGAEEEEDMGRGGVKAGEEVVPEAIKERSPASSVATAGSETADKPAQSTLSTGVTARRHKHTPSTGSFVTTIAEGDEDGDDKKGGILSTAPSLVSTVRRDPLGSPPKSPKRSVPVVKLPDIEDKGEEQELAAEPENTSTKSKDEGDSGADSSEAVAEKISEMSIADSAKPAEEVKKDDETEATASAPAEPAKVEEEDAKPSKEVTEPTAETETATADEAATAPAPASTEYTTEQKDVLPAETEQKATADSDKDQTKTGDDEKKDEPEAGGAATAAAEPES